MSKVIEKWKRYEMVLKGPAGGNPFRDVQLLATFEWNNHFVTVDGFYDGKNTYKVRFMPEFEGNYTVKTRSNVPELNNQKDRFKVVPSGKDNHGPVRVCNKTHFAFADETGYIPFGTTAYAWGLQPEEVRNQTLETLKENKFNKIRMMVFPKSYNFNTVDPTIFPFEGKPKVKKDARDWNVKPEEVGFDFTRPIPQYFQNLENNIEKLDELGIQADLILFSPYDRWGFSRMGRQNNLEYLKYLIARVASYKNVWWSLANEYDLMVAKHQISLKDWDIIGRYVYEKDPSRHLESIHNFYDPPEHKDTTQNWYDHTKPWITHLSVQSDNVFMVPKWIKEYNKPVIVDECRYEGNIPYGWGDDTPQGMTDNFWRVILRGGGCTHGETYVNNPESKHPIWWSHGGKLYGQSQKKINFLSNLLKENAFDWVVPQALTGHTWELAVGSSPDKKRWLVYCGRNQPKYEILSFLPKGKKYSAKLIDAWNETIKQCDYTVTYTKLVGLPQKPFQAILLIEK